MMRGSLLGRDPSGTQSVLAWTVRGAWSARCRCLLRTVCRSRVQTSWPARAPCPHLPSQQTGKAEAAHPHACFSKGYSSTAPCTPLQHLWGSKTHTHACLHTHAHTHAHAHTYTNTNACVYTHRRTHTHIHMHMHAHKHTDTRAHTHSHTHTHAMHAHVARVMGLANSSASLAALPHLSHLLCSEKKNYTVSDTIHTLSKCPDQYLRLNRLLSVRKSTPNYH